MKFLAVTIALAGLAAAIPQAVPPQANGPCDEGGPKDKVCTEKDILADNRVPGNSISCDMSQGDPADFIWCSIDQGRNGTANTDELSEVCGTAGGCTKCLFSLFTDRNSKRIGGRVAEFFCDLRPETKTNGEAQKAFINLIEKKVQRTCERKKVDEDTCKKAKFDCINEKKSGATTWDIDICVSGKL